MKNFDLENLERKNTYKVPGDFFSEMQDNVLKATVQTTPLTLSEAPSKKKNWWYAAAATVAVLLSSVFFLNRESGAEALVQENVNKPKATETKQEINKPLAAQTHESADNYHTFVSDLTLVEKQNQTFTETKSLAKAEPAPAKLKKASKENVVAPVEQILEELSEEEIALLAKNTEQDIYLDLYN